MQFCFSCLSGSYDCKSSAAMQVNKNESQLCNCCCRAYLKTTFAILVPVFCRFSVSICQKIMDTNFDHSCWRCMMTIPCIQQSHSLCCKLQIIILLVKLDCCAMYIVHMTCCLNVIFSVATLFCCSSNSVSNTIQENSSIVSLIHMC